MSLRSVWKGHLRFSLIAIAVKLYAAIETAEAIKFNELHRGECSGRIGREKKCKKCAATVADSDIVKGYQYEPDQYLLVGEDDLKSIKLPTDKIVDIVGFVERDEVPSLYYDEPYYLGADGPTAERPYALLRDVMNQSGKVALGKVTMRGREEFVVVSPAGSGLALQKLRYQHELRNIVAVPGIPNGIKAEKAEMDLASTLVEQMTTNFNVVEAHDRYHEAMKAMLEAKKTGETVTVAAEAPVTPAADIMAALKASLAVAKNPVRKASLKLVTAKAKKEKLPKAA